eukprot:scaffold270520_cov14-Tisochrysis_lutea.AAC.1
MAEVGSLPENLVVACLRGWPMEVDIVRKCKGGSSTKRLKWVENQTVPLVWWWLIKDHGSGLYEKVAQ